MSITKHSTTSELRLYTNELLAKFRNDRRSEVERTLERLFLAISIHWPQVAERLSRWSVAMLRVKLVRMFQRSAQPTVSASDLVSALIAKPDFLLSPRGSINHLLEVARQRTAQESSAREKSKALSHRLRLLEAAERVVTTGDGAYALFRITETEQIRSDGRQLKNCLKGLPDVYVSGRREPM